MCALGWIPWLDTGVCRCFREFHIEAANLTAAEDMGYKGQDDLLYGFRMVLLTVCHFFFCAENIFRQWTAICLFSWGMLGDVGKNSGRNDRDLPNRIDGIDC